MKKYSVLIADDEPIQRRIMRGYCEQSGLFGMVAEAKDGVDALGQLHNQSFDLILLDINMPGLSGLSLAKAITPKTKVVFVTAFSEHAVEAFELNALDYLMKPVSFERFIKAVQKLAVATAGDSVPPVADVPVSGFVTVKQGKKSMKLKAAEILYCEAKGNNIRIYMVDGSYIDIYQTFTSFTESLDSEIFIRIHRSYIVNRQHIVAVENSLLTVGSHKVPVGSNYRDILKGLWA